MDNIQEVKEPQETKEGFTKMVYTFDKPEIEEIKVGKNKIKVNPYISLVNQKKMIGYYLYTYFKESFDDQSLFTIQPRYNHFLAEMVLNVCLLDLQTDIDTSNFDYETFEHAGGFTEIHSTISNYHSVYSNVIMMTSIVEKQLELSKNIEEIKSQIFSFISEFNEKFNAEDMKKQLQEVLEEVRNSPLEPLLKEAQLQPKTKKSIKKKVE